MALDPEAVLPKEPLPNPLRVAFFGSPAFGVPILEALLASPRVCAVPLVVSQPARRAGRGRNMRQPPVAAAAEEAGIPLLQPEMLQPGEMLPELAAGRIAVIAVAAYGLKLPRAILEAPRFGCCNVHPSLLPKYRGAAPINWAIIQGETETGVSTMWMEERIDTGPILLQRRTPIEPLETAGELSERLAALGADLLLETLEALRGGRLRATPQPREGASRARRLMKADGVVDWHQDARRVLDLIRGVTPWPGALTAFRQERIKLLGARPVGPGEAAQIAAEEPGTVTHIDEDGLWIRCADGAVILTHLQRPGRKAQPAADFLRGCPVTIGERLHRPE